MIQKSLKLKSSKNLKINLKVEIIYSNLNSVFENSTQKQSYNTNIKKNKD